MLQVPGGGGTLPGTGSNPLPVPGGGGGGKIALVPEGPLVGGAAFTGGAESGGGGGGAPGI